VILKIFFKMEGWSEFDEQPVAVLPSSDIFFESVNAVDCFSFSMSPTKRQRTLETLEAVAKDLSAIGVRPLIQEQEPEPRREPEKPHQADTSEDTDRCHGVDRVVVANYREIDVTPYFGMKQADAAAKLDIAVTTLSKRWKIANRDSGRTWPYQLVLKVDAKIRDLMECVEADADAIPPDIEDELTKLLLQRSKLLSPVTIQHYQQNKKKGTNGTNGTPDRTK
jgi:hypothetical protein